MEVQKPIEQKSITTIKLASTSKERMNHLRIYRRESYDEIMRRILEILNLCRIAPERARARLLFIDKERKRNIKVQNSFVRRGNTETRSDNQ